MHTYTTLPYLQVWPNCKLSSSNGEMAGHDVFHKRYSSSFSAVSSYLLHTSYSTTLCVCSVVSTSFLMIISFVMEKSLRSVRQMRYWAEKSDFKKKRIVPILIYLSLLFFWYLMSENQRCIKTTQLTNQLGSILLY